MISQYQQRTYIDVNGNKVSARYTPYKPDETKTIVLEKDLTLDEVALDVYGTPLYYWLIGETNNIADPFVKIKKGTSLKIPVL